ncbi:MAG: YncE family protein, partial [Pseudomonadota bacterium]
LRAGADTSVSVVDLNGFGQSTGDPDPAVTNFINNPNLLFQGPFLRPPLAPGSTTLDGGSAGVFTLTKSATLDDKLVGRPTIVAPVDAMLGHPLDLVFNNGLAAGGCQAGGGNLCAITGKQFLSVTAASPTALKPTDPGDSPVHVALSGGNPISWAPHPNPPTLITPPLCQQPMIDGQEPTSVDHFAGVNGASPVLNLLGPGDPFGNPVLGIPPSGLLAAQQNAFFQGPSTSGIPLAACQPYAIRQQVGHHLYVADAGTDEIVVLNSNRMTVLDRIPVAGPTELAMSPDLTLLAVASRANDLVTFIDIDPLSLSFHQVVKTTPVGDRPSGIAWSPDDEDILVANEGSGTVSVLSGFTLDVRKTLTRGLQRPFAIATTPRQSIFGGERNLWYAWILDRTPNDLRNVRRVIIAYLPFALPSCPIGDEG